MNKCSAPFLRIARSQLHRDSLKAVKERRRFLLRLARRRSRVDFVSRTEFLVCSPGGVATTALMEHLARFVTINDPDDRDGLKHPSRVPLGAQKILYITGQSRDIVASLKRRGWVDRQSAKLGAPLGVLLSGRPAELALTRAIKLQERNFRLHAPGRQVLVVDYQELWDAVDLIGDFFGIHDASYASGFPTRRPRSGQASSAT